MISNNLTNMHTTIMFNYSKIDDRIQKAVDRKNKLDEDQFKRKLFMLNRREFLRDTREVKF